MQTCSKPAKCMVILEKRKELWVGSGNQIVIVDIHSRVVLKRLSVTDRHEQTALLSLLCTDGETKVWSSLWKHSLVTEWNVQSREKTYEYYCSEKHALGVGVRYKAGTFSCSIRQLSVEIPEQVNEEPLISNSRRMVEESLFKRPSLRFPTRTYMRNKSSTSSSTSSLYNLTSSEAASFNRAVTSLQLVGNVLWVGRTSGDVLALDYTTGHVTTILGKDKLRLLGNEKRCVQSMVSLASNSLAICVRMKPKKEKRRTSVPVPFLYERKEHFQILVYNVLSNDQLLLFNERSREIFDEIV